MEKKTEGRDTKRSASHNTRSHNIGMTAVLVNWLGHKIVSFLYSPLTGEAIDSQYKKGTSSTEQI